MIRDVEHGPGGYAFEERERVAGLGLQLVRAHEPELEELFRIEWSGRFVSRLGDASYVSPMRAALVAEMLARKVAHSEVRYQLGTASPDPMARVRLSLPLWPRISEGERDDTVAHEVAHLIVMHRQVRGDYGKGEKVKPHGPEWRAVMRLELGYAPHATSRVRIDRTGLSGVRKRYPLVCVGCGEELLVGRKRSELAERYTAALLEHGSLIAAREHSEDARKSLHHRPCQKRGAHASLLVPPSQRGAATVRVAMEQLTLEALSALPSDLK